MVVTHSALRRLVLAFGLLAGAPAALTTATAAPLDDPNTVLTVMQFSARGAAALPELKKRMAAMRDFQRKQPGYVENALMENRNPQTKPHFVGVARWKSVKDWETMWQKEEFQKLVRSIGEVGDVTPGVFSAVR